MNAWGCRLQEFRADLHLHSCLSPCADLYMTPLRVARRALEAGMEIVAFCDHNSAENTLYGRRACEKLGGPTFIAGIEVTSAEEVHVVGLFRGVEEALRMQKIVYAKLPPAAPGWGSDVAGGRWGLQVVVNEEDEVEGFCDRMLIGATGMNLREIVDTIHALGGLAIAAHADRESFGLIGHLGFIPQDVRFDAVELASAVAAEGATNGAVAWTAHGEVEGDRWAGLPVIYSSDAHRLEQIGLVGTRFMLQAPEFEEIRMALEGVGGRKVVGICR